jgi:hypothetical protein
MIPSSSHNWKPRLDVSRGFLFCTDCRKLSWAQPESRRGVDGGAYQE